MLEKVRERLTPDAKYWYKLWSSWLALAWGGIVYLLWDDPSTVGQLLAVIPAPYKDHLGGVVAVVASALPIIVRCLKQGSLQKPPHG